MTAQHRARRGDVGTLRATRFTKPMPPVVAELASLLDEAFARTDTVRIPRTAGATS